MIKSLLFSCSSGIDSEGDEVGAFVGEEVDALDGASVGPSVGILVGKRDGGNVRGAMGVAVLFFVGGPSVNDAGDANTGGRKGAGVGTGIGIGAAVGGGVAGSSHRTCSSALLSPTSLLLSV